MKTNLTQAFLVLAMALILESCGGSQGGATNSHEGRGQNPSQVIYSSDEIDLGNKIEGCFKTYEANVEEMKNQDIESRKLVAIGMTGHECLEIKDPMKLNRIHSEYKLHTDGVGKNWNLIARELLTKDTK